MLEVRLFLLLFNRLHMQSSQKHYLSLLLMPHCLCRIHVFVLEIFRDIFYRNDVELKLL
jgi:hypothetical protein